MPGSFRKNSQASQGTSGIVSPWDFPGGPVVMTLPSIVGMQVQSLAGELRSTCLPAKNKQKTKQCYNKLSKDFFNGPHKKKTFKKFI